jgi:hypothetical protein
MNLQLTVYFLAYFAYFEKIKIGVWDHYAVYLSVYLCSSY